MFRGPTSQPVYHALGHQYTPRLCQMTVDTMNVFICPLTRFGFNPAGCIATLLTRKPGAGPGLVGDKPTMLQIVVIDILLVVLMLMIIAILNVSL